MGGEGRGVTLAMLAAGSPVRGDLNGPDVYVAGGGGGGGARVVARGDVGCRSGHCLGIFQDQARCDVAVGERVSVP